MMRERRNFRRIVINASVLIFVEDYAAEISGRVKDISEESIGLEFNINDELKKALEDKGMVRFQFVDTYRDGSRNRTEVVQACALIKRTTVAEDVCIIGCMVRDDNFKKYVVKRKLSAYFT